MSYRAGLRPASKVERKLEGDLDFQPGLLLKGVVSSPADLGKEGSEGGRTPSRFEYTEILMCGPFWKATETEVADLKEKSLGWGVSVLDSCMIACEDRPWGQLPRLGHSK